jgi:hypothetical protein
VVVQPAALQVAADFVRWQPERGRRSCRSLAIFFQLDGLRFLKSCRLGPGLGRLIGNADIFEICAEHQRRSVFPLTHFDNIHPIL